MAPPPPRKQQFLEAARVPLKAPRAPVASPPHPLAPALALARFKSPSSPAAARPAAPNHPFRHRGLRSALLVVLTLTCCSPFLPYSLPPSPSPASEQGGLCLCQV